MNEWSFFLTNWYSIFAFFYLWTWTHILTYIISSDAPQTLELHQTTATGVTGGCKLPSADDGNQREALCKIIMCLYPPSPLFSLSLKFLCLDLLCTYISYLGFPLCLALVMLNYLMSVYHMSFDKLSSLKKGFYSNGDNMPIQDQSLEHHSDLSWLMIALSPLRL